MARRSYYMFQSSFIVEADSLEKAKEIAEQYGLNIEFICECSEAAVQENDDVPVINEAKEIKNGN